MLNIRWGARWKPPKNITTTIRLLPGNYTSFEEFPQAYYSYVEHFVAGVDKSLICSKRYKYVNDELTTVEGKCLACDLRDEERAKNIGWRIMHVFNAIHLVWYHKVPLIDRTTGKVRVYTRGSRKGEPMTDLVQCEGRRCKMCADHVEKVFGRKVHWSMGNSHLEQLGGFIKELRRNCTCGGLLTDISYDCPNCGVMWYDIQEADPLEADAVGARKFTCKSCGTTDFPLKRVECSKCQDPEPISVFDCNLEIKRTGDNTASAIQIPRYEVAKLPTELLELSKPWPFEKIFAGDPFDMQAKILGVRNPYADDVSSHVEDYDDV
jgi:hypothetical protein